MKKLALILCILMLILSSCGDVSETTGNAATSQVTTTQKTEQKAPQKVEVPYERAQAIKLSEVDFTAFGDRYDTKEGFSLEKFLPVLKNEAKFKWQNGEALEVTMSEFHKALWGDNESLSDELMVYGFIVKNIDGVDDAEVVLDLADLAGTYLVLTVGEDGIYGKEFPIRIFNLLESGLYQSSSSAGSGSYNMLMFDDGEFIEHKVATYDGDKYTLKGDDVTKEDFDAFFAKFDMNPVNYIDVAK